MFLSLVKVAILQLLKIIRKRIPSLAGKVNISSEVGDEALKYINAATHCVLYYVLDSFKQNNKWISGRNAGK